MMCLDDATADWSALGDDDRAVVENRVDDVAIEVFPGVAAARAEALIDANGELSTCWNTDGDGWRLSRLCSRRRGSSGSAGVRRGWALGSRGQGGDDRVSGMGLGARRRRRDQG
jgi:hypothetical protein